jgi:arylsulfatase
MKNIKKAIVLLAIGICVLSWFVLLKKNRTIRHVFLITIDTLRADHLSCNGYIRQTTPFIDGLAAKGVQFSRAYSASATTATSHASILTGLYPGQHRVLANGHRLADSATTLAEILSENKVKTAAFTSTSAHFLAANMDQGFEFYEEPENALKTYGIKYRPAKLTVDNAIIWMDNFPEQKNLFMWIHLFDPHLPYAPPAEYVKEIKQSADLEKFEKYLQPRMIDLEIFNQDANRKKLELLHYDAEIRYVDSQLQRFYNFIKTKRMLEDSLFIITADHGEGLGQHHWYQHAYLLYEEAVRVPLIFYSPVIEKFAKKIDQPIENFNIFSTVLDVFAVKTPPSSSAIQSVSLKNTIFGTDMTIAKKTIFLQRQLFDQTKKVSPEKQRLGQGECHAVIEGNLKYIFWTAYDHELYDLQADPFELNNQLPNVSFKNPLNHLKAKMHHHLDMLKPYKDQQIQKVDKNTIKQLKSLGYLQ